MDYIITPVKKINGTISIPPSKSHTMRAILFASLAKGKSIIKNYLAQSPDTEAMLGACRALGAEIKVLDRTAIMIRGVEGKPITPEDVINAGNSGQVLRFISAIAALNTNYTVITGDKSIRSIRPVLPLVKGLRQLGGFCVSTKGDGYAPVIVRGPLKASNIIIDGEDSQPVSALLITSAFISGTTKIHVKNPGEKPWVNLTLDWFKRLGISFINENFVNYTIHGTNSYDGFNYQVPGDFSSAIFPIAAAIITKSELTLANIDMNDVQGDKELISILKNMGVSIYYDAVNKLLRIIGQDIKSFNINVNNFIDAVTIIAVLACYAQETSYITGAAIAKYKECNRLQSITTELNKMGGNVQVTEDGLIIKPSKLKGTIVESYDDHRMAMSLIIAALGAEGNTIIKNTSCITKTFPNFVDDFKNLGVNIISKCILF
jgi:3-phosphoshikimate 1-carboxyvinyltransferase